MEESLIQYLVANAGVAAIAGSRGYPGRAPQGAALPRYVVQKVAGAPEYDDDGEVGLEDLRFQIDSWGASYADAKLLSRAIKTALTGFDGAMGSVEIAFVTLEDERDDPTNAESRADHPFRVSQDYQVWQST